MSHLAMNTKTKSSTNANGCSRYRTAALRIYDLPLDIVLLISRRLPPYDLMHLSSTCTSFRPVFFNKSVWLHIADIISRSKPLPFTGSRASSLHVQQLQRACLRSQRVMHSWSLDDIQTHPKPRRIQVTRNLLIDYFTFLPGSKHLLVYDAHGSLSCWTCDGVMLMEMKMDRGTILTRWKPKDDGALFGALAADGDDGDDDVRVIEIMLDQPKRERSGRRHCQVLTLTYSDTYAHFTKVNRFSLPPAYELYSALVHGDIQGMLIHINKSLIGVYLVDAKSGKAICFNTGVPVASQPQALISAHHMVLYWESPSRGAYVRAYEMDTLRRLIHERGLDQDDVRLNTPFRLDPSYSRVIPFGTRTSMSYMPLPSGGLRQNGLGVGVGHGGEGVGGLNGIGNGNGNGIVNGFMNANVNGALVNVIDANGNVINVNGNGANLDIDLDDDDGVGIVENVQVHNLNNNNNNNNNNDNNGVELEQLGGAGGGLGVGVGVGVGVGAGVVGLLFDDNTSSWDFSPVIIPKWLTLREDSTRHRTRSIMSFSIRVGGVFGFGGVGGLGVGVDGLEVGGVGGGVGGGGGGGGGLDGVGVGVGFGVQEIEIEGEEWGQGEDDDDDDDGVGIVGFGHDHGMDGEDEEVEVEMEMEMEMEVMQLEVVQPGMNGNAHGHGNNHPHIHANDVVLVPIGFNNANLNLNIDNIIDDNNNLDLDLNDFDTHSRRATISHHYFDFLSNPLELKRTVMAEVVLRDPVRIAVNGHRVRPFNVSPIIGVGGRCALWVQQNAPVAVGKSSSSSPISSPPSSSTSSTPTPTPTPHQHHQHQHHPTAYLRLATFPPYEGDTEHDTVRFDELDAGGGMVSTVHLPSEVDLNRAIMFDLDDVRGHVGVVTVEEGGCVIWVVDYT